MDNYPPGAANDPMAPYNESLPETRKLIVEANAEIGIIVGVEVKIDDGDILIDEMQEEVRKAIIDKLNIDDKEVILNDVTIHYWKYG